MVARLAVQAATRIARRALAPFLKSRPETARRLPAGRVSRDGRLSPGAGRAVDGDADGAAAGLLVDHDRGSAGPGVRPGVRPPLTVECGEEDVLGASGEPELVGRLHRKVLDDVGDRGCEHLLLRVRRGDVLGDSAV